MEAANWLTIIISAAAAVAATIAALYARTEALAAKKQATAAERQHELAEREHELAELVRCDQVQPYVVADIRPGQDGFLMILIVENTGPTVARNVRVSFDPQLRSTTFPEVGDLRFLREGIKALPPGRRVSWYFDTGPAIFENDVPRKYQVDVRYDGPLGVSGHLEYEIDFSILENSEARDPGKLKDISDELKKANATLRSIAQQKANP